MEGSFGASSTVDTKQSIAKWIIRSLGNIVNNNMRLHGSVFRTHWRAKYPDVYRPERNIYNHYTYGFYAHSFSSL